MHANNFKIFCYPTRQPHRFGILISVPLFGFLPVGHPDIVIRGSVFTLCDPVCVGAIVSETTLVLQSLLGDDMCALMS